MKTFITSLAFAALATTSAIAQAPKVKTIKANPANIYQSYSQSNQTFPNPDRDFQGEYAHSADYY
jgi:hypothetical protein